MGNARHELLSDWEQFSPHSNGVKKRHYKKQNHLPIHLLTCREGQESLPPPVLAVLQEVFRIKGVWSLPHVFVKHYWSQAGHQRGTLKGWGKQEVPWRANMLPAWVTISSFLHTWSKILHFFFFKHTKCFSKPTWLNEGKSLQDCSLQCATVHLHAADPYLVLLLIWIHF